MLVIAPTEAHGGRSLARCALYPVDASQSLESGYWIDKYATRPTNNNPRKEELLPPTSGRFHRLFALTGKVAGLLAPGEATRATCNAEGQIIEDTTSRVPDTAVAPDTSVEVRYDFAPPLPPIQPTDTCLILSRRYVVSRLEYTIQANGTPHLTGYFYPAD